MAKASRMMSRILMLHERYPVAHMEQAIERAITYGCVHLDGVLYCLHELAKEAEPSEPVETKPLDLTSRPALDAVGNQPVDLSRYEKLLKLSQVREKEGTAHDAAHCTEPKPSSIDFSPICGR